MGLRRLFDRLTPLIDIKEDIIQAWKLSAGESAEGLALGPVIPLDVEVLVLGAEEPEAETDFDSLE